jgi:hypothetical protein
VHGSLCGALAKGVRDVLLLLVSLREKSQTQSILITMAIDFWSHCSRHPRSLGYNNIGHAGAQHLAEALALNTTFKTLMSV